MYQLLSVGLMLIPLVTFAQADVTENDVNQIMAKLDEVEGPVVLNSCDRPRPLMNIEKKPEHGRGPAVVEQFGRTLRRNR